MNRAILEYYRCPERYIKIELAGKLSKEQGYFKFADEGIYYGQLCNAAPASALNGNLHDATCYITTAGGVTYLPFDPAQVADNLRFELYADGGGWKAQGVSSLQSALYYWVRPFLPVSLRKHLQKARLSDWKDLTFPRWPVDRSVDLLFEQVLLMQLRAQKLDRIPFIWFWPEGASSCAVMTHDVETQAGRDHCAKVMDLEDSYEMKACFAVVPERRYEVTQDFLDSIRRRGFEVAVHDLNHDGHLFRDRREFLVRASQINDYGRRFGAHGFRSAVLYRNQLWFDALQFSYDMSVPNVGHLEAQRGGCCTVMPYYVGDILELPVTTVQDYALFNYLNDYSIDVWRQQTEIILANHGLMNFIVHPDYITKPLEWRACQALLAHLAELRDQRGLWITTPSRVNEWWRQRARLRLVEGEEGIKIEGEGGEMACVAYAREENGKLVYSLEKKPSAN